MKSNDVEFVNTIRELNPDIVDLADAIYYAMNIVGEVKPRVWFGAIEDGVFYLDDNGMKWYANCGLSTAAWRLSQELVGEANV